MPEVDGFDTRLTAAVRSFADRAEVAVDASAMAARVAGRRRRPALAWFGAPLPATASMLLAAGLLLLLLSSFGLAGAPWDRLARLFLPPAPSPTSVAPAPTATPLPTVTPPSPAGAAAGHTTGKMTLSVVSEGRSTVVGDVTQVHGRELATVSSMGDPQVTGTGTLLVNVDLHGAVGPQWGTYHLENADGAWDGTCAGASWDGGDAVDIACWLVGSGAYEGSTYHLVARGTDALAVEGSVIPGSPPGQ